MRPSLNPDNDLQPEPRSGAYPARATIPTWCSLSGMGHTMTYQALGTGHLKAVKMGTRTLIDVPHGLAWLDSLPPVTSEPSGTGMKTCGLRGDIRTDGGEVPFAGFGRRLHAPPAITIPCTPVLRYADRIAGSICGTAAMPIS